MSVLQQVRVENSKRILRFRIALVCRSLGNQQSSPMFISLWEGVKQCHKPAMTGNGSYLYNIYIYIRIYNIYIPLPTYKNGDDWGLIALSCYSIHEASFQCWDPLVSSNVAGKSTASNYWCWISMGFPWLMTV